MPKSMLLRAITFIFLVFQPSAQAYHLKNHSWTIDDIDKSMQTPAEIVKALRTNWDYEASSEDIAHLYSYQLMKKFKLSTAKIFLFTHHRSVQVATLINQSNELLALDQQDKTFIPMEDWMLRRADSYCTELVNPNDQVIFLMQINRFKPKTGNCYFMIVPAHLYQQIELYPSSTPKEFIQADAVEACYQATDRKLFKKDKKRCESWVRNL